MSARVRIDFVFDEGADIGSVADAMKVHLASSDDATVSDVDSDGRSEFTAWLTRRGDRIEWNSKTYTASARHFTVPNLPTIEAQVYSSALDSSTGIDAEALPQLVRETYSASEPRPTYVYGLDEGHAEIIGEDGPDSVPVLPETLEVGEINAVSWLMLFPPALVASYDREFLLDAPAWRTDELDDGSILLVACPDPTDYGALDESLPELREYFGTEHPRL